MYYAGKKKKHEAALSLLIWHNHHDAVLVTVLTIQNIFF